MIFKIMSLLPVLHVDGTRVGNLLFGFSSELLVFCMQKIKIAIRSWKRLNRSRRSLVKSNRSKLLMVALF